MHVCVRVCGEACSMLRKTRSEQLQLQEQHRRVAAGDSSQSTNQPASQQGHPPPQPQAAAWGGVLT